MATIAYGDRMMSAGAVRLHDFSRLSQKNIYHKVIVENIIENVSAVLLFDTHFITFIKQTDLRYLLVPYRVSPSARPFLHRRRIPQ